MELDDVFTGKKHSFEGGSPDLLQELAEDLRRMTKSDIVDENEDL